MPDAGTGTAPSAQAIRHGVAEANGIQIHFAAAGAGKLILFLHGFPEFWYAWRAQLAEFSRDFLAVAPDMRGYNLSSKPAAAEQYTLQILAEDIRALAAQFTSEPFVLAGHDWGGVVAWAFAAQHPNLLEKLVIINAPHPAVFDRELRENVEQQKASSYMLLFRTPEAESIISANNFGLFQGGMLADGLRQGYFSEADCRAYLQAWSQPGALTGGLNYYRAARAGPPYSPAGNLTPLAGQIASAQVRVPTLVIWGENDPYLLTGNLRGLEAFVPNLQIHGVPGSTHWVVHEKPELVNFLIRTFVCPAQS